MAMDRPLVFSGKETNGGQEDGVDRILAPTNNRENKEVLAHLLSNSLPGYVMEITTQTKKRHEKNTYSDMPQVLCTKYT